MGSSWSFCLGPILHCIEISFNFIFDSSYRDTYTPSSVSPGSSCMPSPISYTMESPSPCGTRSFSASCESGSPPCTTADLQEFLQVRQKPKMLTPGQIPLKVPNIKFNFDISVDREHWQTVTSKLNLRPCNSVQLSIRC